MAKEIEKVFKIGLIGAFGLGVIAASGVGSVSAEDGALNLATPTPTLSPVKESVLRQYREAEATRLAPTAISTPSLNNELEAQDFSDCRGEEGVSTWYSLPGQIMANGRSMSNDGWTAAAINKYPLGSHIDIRNLNNGLIARGVEVTDRGRLAEHGISTDTTPRVASVLRFIEDGRARICITYSK